MPGVPAHRLTIALSVALLLDGCASSPAFECRPPLEPAIQDTLYFGTGVADGSLVSPEDWSLFLAAVVTPRFPDGLTVTQAAGQWRGNDGTIGHETSYVLQLVYADDATSAQAVTEITDAYKTQFRQEAVLRVSEIVCVAF